VLLLATGLFAGCQAASGAPTTSAPVSVAAASTPSVATTMPDTSATPAPTPTATAPTKPLAGRTIVIDPGHNGVWTRRELRKVPSGNGRTKECNSSGTATNAGYPEHAYNWAQANALARALRARGATVRLTRPDDHGEGPCVNLRSKLANDLRADALVSIHADGNLSRGARGFHVIHSPTMTGGTKVEQKSLALAKQVRHALETETPMPRSTYVGGGTALDSRNDLGTLNLSDRPAVMIEMGNMRNATDAALFGSAAFRAKVATALADAVQTFLG
jgi:N-acetylmuramoyl-L-alanine amidase